MTPDPPVFRLHSRTAPSPLPWLYAGPHALVPSLQPYASWCSVIAHSCCALMHAPPDACNSTTPSALLHEAHHTGPDSSMSTDGVEACADPCAMLSCLRVGEGRVAEPGGRAGGQRHGRQRGGQSLPGGSRGHPPEGAPGQRHAHPPGCCCRPLGRGPLHLGALGGAGPAAHHCLTPGMHAMPTCLAIRFFCPYVRGRSDYQDNCLYTQQGLAQSAIFLATLIAG